MALSITVTELAAVKVKGCQQCARFEEKKNIKVTKKKNWVYMLHIFYTNLLEIR